MDIIITSNPEKMIEMAKSIVAEKRSYYSEVVLDSIRSSVQTHINSSEYTSDEIEDLMYKTIYYYWAYGCTSDEFFYLELAEKTHEEIKEYVTARERVIYRNRLNNTADAHILNNKWETYCTFKEYFKRDVIFIRDDSDYDIFCNFVEKHPEFVVKPADMGGGQGVHKSKVNKGISDEERKMRFHDILSECEENKRKYLRGRENGIILEEIINQAPEMAAFHPASVNAVRITTVKVGDKINILHPWFKIGRGGQFLTSAVYGTLDACIDVEKGNVITPGYTERNECFDNHPDTGIQFQGFIIPRWKELIDLAKELASKLTTINYVGWDLVLTEQGWVLMEGNFSGDFMWQMCLKKGSKKEIENLIDWHLTKEFWWQE